MSGAEETRETECPEPPTSAWGGDNRDSLMDRSESSGKFKSAARKASLVTAAAAVAAAAGNHPLSSPSFQEGEHDRGSAISLTLCSVFAHSRSLFARSVLALCLLLAHA